MRSGWLGWSSVKISLLSLILFLSMHCIVAKRRVVNAEAGLETLKDNRDELVQIQGDSRLEKLTREHCIIRILNTGKKPVVAGLFVMSNKSFAIAWADLYTRHPLKQFQPQQLRLPCKRDPNLKLKLVFFKMDRRRNPKKDGDWSEKGILWDRIEPVRSGFADGQTYVWGPPPLNSQLQDPELEDAMIRLSKQTTKFFIESTDWFRGHEDWPHEWTVEEDSKPMQKKLHEYRAELACSLYAVSKDNEFFQVAGQSLEKARRKHLPFRNGAPGSATFVKYEGSKKVQMIVSGGAPFEMLILRTLVKEADLKLLGPSHRLTRWKKERWKKPKPSLSRGRRFTEEVFWQNTNADIGLQLNQYPIYNPKFVIYSLSLRCKKPYKGTGSASELAKNFPFLIRRQ